MPMLYTYDGQPPLPHQPRMEHSMWMTRLGYLNYIQDRMVCAASEWAEALLESGGVDTEKSRALDLRRIALADALDDCIRLKY